VVAAANELEGGVAADASGRAGDEDGLRFHVLLVIPMLERERGCATVGLR
jgi:hypothetical protein